MEMALESRLCLPLCPLGNPLCLPVCGFPGMGPVQEGPPLAGCGVPKVQAAPQEQQQQVRPAAPMPPQQQQFTPFPAPQEA